MKGYRLFHSLYLIIIGILCLCSCATRKRSVSDLKRIPWQQVDSTFHNFGFPLIGSLCSALDTDNPAYLYLKCDTIKVTIWPKSCHPATRNGSLSSAIIVDPHVIAVETHTESAGGFVMNAIYPALYELGYGPHARYWSESLNYLFDADIAKAATESSARWDAYVEHDQPNPFEDLENYILFQNEVGQVFIDKIRTLAPTNASPYGRNFRWVIGLHEPSTHERYASELSKTHCIGANFYLSEGLYCPSASVIPCPMFPFHLQESATPSSSSGSGSGSSSGGSGGTSSSSINSTDGSSSGRSSGSSDNSSGRSSSSGSIHTKKENLVLVDSDAVSVFPPEELQRDLRALGLMDVQVVEHRGRERRDVPALYRRVKVSLDCRNGGVEFINYEAVLYDVLTLSCSSRATRNAFDFPVPSKYLLEPTQWNRTVATVYDALVHYEQRLPDFAVFQQLSRSSPWRFRQQLDMHLFARDVVFRTWCRSYAECRRVVPWAVAVWTAFPLSRIEIYCSIPVDEFRLDNDVALQLLSRSFSESYFALLQYDEYDNEGLHPVSFYAQWPCSHVVYMHVNLIPLGRDMLNTHLYALLESRREGYIAYYREDEVALSITNMRLFARLVKINSKADVYLEVSGTVRRIENYAVYASIRAHGVTAFAEVETSYLSKRRIGTELSESAWATESGALRPENIIVPTLPVVLDALFIPDSSALTSTSIGEESAPDVSETLAPSVCGCMSHHHSPHTCNSNDHSVGTCTADQESPTVFPSLAEPHLWLAPSTPLLPLSCLSTCLGEAAVEVVVVHLDPLLQNALLQKVLGFLPLDIRQVLGFYDAIHYPNVVSLLDTKHNNWN